MITVRDLTKRYGRGKAVDGLTFTAEPGRVTGFLGPNGAGKSTTMRVLLGLVRPTSGEALVNGRVYERLARPSR
ncbi:ATP-binding cassette domain-containing protein, partial [Nocardiopsis tropica]|nr:ATP-binding cassette domain-containing protein [Nocardiopsis tropica]